MADSTNTYAIQVISQRYIRKNILEDYVNANVEKFGSKWKCVWSRNNKISFTALRSLTNHELDQLQEKSHRASAASNQPLLLD